MQSRAKVVSSIMAKKYAMWVTHSVIDIPVWATAKVTTMEEALDRKQKFEYVGKKLWMKMTVQITPANEVIGNWVWAVLQVREVLRVLQQHEKRPLDLEAKAMFLASKIIEIVWLAKGRDAEKLARKQLTSWAARKKMQEIIKAQHGNPNINSEDLKLWIFAKEVLADKDGKITKVDLHNVNHIARRLGCPAIDEAWIYISKRLWDKVKKWDVLFTMYATAENKIDLALEQNKEKPAMTIG
jgi:thymidine phosphorylase